MKTLRELIKEKGCTNKAVADKLGISQTNIIRYDDLSRRSIEELSIIAEAISMSLSEILEEALGYKVEIKNSTSSQVGNSIGGHNVNIAIPQNAYSKIINDEGIEVTCNPMLDPVSQQIIDSLRNENAQLKKELVVREELIEALKFKISILEAK